MRDKRIERIKSKYPINDRSFALLAINNNPSIWRYFSKKLSNDKELMMMSVKMDGNALQFASLKLKDDYDVVFEALLQDKSFLNYALVRLQKVFLMSLIIQRKKYLVTNKKRTICSFFLLIIEFND